MKRLISTLLTILLIVSSTFVVASAANGTVQKLKYQNKDDGIPMFMATEDGEDFYVYCFSSKLSWPKRPDADSGLTSQYYHPDDFLHLDNYNVTLTDGTVRPVKDMIHRILYAGFPHNNAGLYVEEEREPTLAEMVKGLDFHPHILDKFPELKNGTFTYNADGSGTLNNPNSTEGQIIYDIGLKLMEWSFIGSEQEKQELTNIIINHHQFYSFVYSYHQTISFELDLDEYLPYFYKIAMSSTGMSVSKDQAHSATQIAIWIVLNRAGVPYNPKTYQTQYDDEESLVRRLVDFAYGKEPVPQRNFNQATLNAYKTSFNNGDYLLNENNQSIKEKGGIRFTYNPQDGKYYSEVLKFEKKITSELIEKAYLSEFNIEIRNKNNQVISETIQYGNEDFVLVCDEKPAQTTVSVKSNNYWPKPIYQYIAESDLDKPENKKEFQEMAGALYEKVELSFSMQALDENQDLIIKKTVTNSKAAEGETFWFDANINIKNYKGDQVSGWLDYSKYKLDSSGNLIQSSKTDGKVYNYGNNGGVGGGYNTKFSLKADEAIAIHELPYGTTYEIVEYGLSETGTSTGNWTPTYTGNSGTISATTNEIDVSNAYRFNSVNLQIKGNKSLKDRSNGSLMNFAEDSFSFVMWPDVHGNPMPDGSSFNQQTLRNEKIVTSTAATDENSHQASFDFGTIEFDKAGTYSYTIEEQQVTLANISKDPRYYHVVVEVEENEANLKKTVTVQCHNPDHTDAEASKTLAESTNSVALEYVNTYANNVIYKGIRVKKAIKNNASDLNISREGYEFLVEPVEDSAKYLNFEGTTSKTVTITTGASGEAVTPLLEFKDDWFNQYQTENKVELKYKITEVTGSKAGITYSDETAYATIIIKKIADAQYTAEILYQYGNLTNSSTPAVFTNQYKAQSNVNILIDKTFDSTITYTPAVDETYKFKINDNFERNDKTGYVLPTDKTVTLTYNGTSFVTSNNTITFNKAGDYRFELSELVGDVDGVTYDTSKWILDINVTDKGDGTFETECEYFHVTESLTKHDKATFTNKYKPTVTLDLKISKELLGRELTDNDSFTFSAHHSEGSITNPCDPGNVSHNHTSLEHTGKITLDKLTSFDLTIPNAIKIHKDGKYYVSVSEDAKADSNFEYDTSVYVIEIDAGLDNNKVVINSTKYYKCADANSWDTKVEVTDNIKFTNKTTNLSVKKKTVSCPPGAKFKFEIILTNSDDQPLANKDYYSTINGKSHIITTNDEGKATFSLGSDEVLSIPDLPAGTKYKVKEIDTTTTTSILVKENGVQKSSVDEKEIADALEIGVDELVIVKNKGTYKPSITTTSNKSEEVYKAPNTKV